jgi:hypothetical protein
MFGDVPDAFLLFPGAFHHFVFAVVVVVGEMPHIGDIHHVFHLVAQKFQAAAEQIFDDVGFQVADMGVIVHGGSAGIHFHQVIRNFQRFFGTGCRIVQIHYSFFARHFCNFLPTGILATWIQQYCIA